MLADAPLHYYRFEETSNAQPAADAGTPGGRNGIFNGGITLGQSTAPLQLGRAARFSGNPGTFVDLGLFHPGNNVTVEVWANLDPTANHSPSYHDLVGRMDGSYIFDFAPGDVVNFAAINNSGVMAKGAGATSSTRDAWHHLVGVFSGGTATVYVDGVKGEEQAVGGVLQNLGPTPGRVLIGALRNGSVNSFNWKGLIDEVAIYDHALTPDRILK